MSRYFCHENPATLRLETKVVDAQPGRVRLESSPFYPGGGGQLADRGVLRWAHGEVAVAGIEMGGPAMWLLLAEPVEVSGTVEALVDETLRRMQTELHTDLHIV